MIRLYLHDGIHDRLEEVGHDQADNTADAGNSADEDNHHTGTGAVNAEQERGRDEGEEGSADLHDQLDPELSGLLYE